jgi:hypothetical protein
LLYRSCARILKDWTLEDSLLAFLASLFLGVGKRLRTKAKPVR